jgi:hypothetical protein
MYEHNGREVTEYFQQVLQWSRQQDQEISWGGVKLI